MGQGHTKDKHESGRWHVVHEVIDSWPDWLIFGIGTSTIAGIFMVLARFVAILDFFFALNLLLWFLAQGFMTPGYFIETAIFGKSGYVGSETGFILFSGLAGLISLISWFFIGAFIGNLKIDYMKRFYLIIALVLFFAVGFFRLISN